MRISLTPGDVKIDPSAAAPMIERAIEIAATFVQSRAVEVCPVDTGTLARSIRVGEQEGPATAPSRRVLTGVHYAPYVEFGTRHQRAQPFLGPALEQARRRYGGA